MCESERAVLRKAYLQIPTYRAPQVPAGYFCRYTQGGTYEENAERD